MSFICYVVVFNLFYFQSAFQLPSAYLA